ncbi:MAG: serine protease Do [Parasphingorhabdus sp.]
MRGLLAEDLNFVSGEISALAGMGDDHRYLQVSAPLQPGNSGGPLVDQSSNVIRMVVSKLNAISVAKVTGEIPQNVIFAIKGVLLRSFLDIHGIDYKTSNNRTELSSAEVAKMAPEFTVPIECYQ